MKLPASDPQRFDPIDWDRVKQEVADRLGPDGVARAFEACGVKFTEEHPNGKSWRECWAIDREETRPSAGVHLVEAKYHDFGSGKKSIHLFDFAIQYGDKRFPRWIDAAKHYAEQAGVEIGKPDYGTKGRIRDGYYDYLDAAGMKRYRTFRYIHPLGGKDFSQAPFDSEGRIRGGKGCMQGIDPLPYRLPELIASRDAGDPMWIVEGEKKADRLAAEGMIATTNHGGTSNTDYTWPKFKVEWFINRTCYLLPDCDPVGKLHMAKVAAWLRTCGAASVKVIDLPGLVAGEDILDWLRQGGTIEGLGRLAHEAPEWEPAAEPDPPEKQEDGKAPFRSATVADVRRLLANTKWHWEGWIPTSRVCGIGGLEGTGKTRFAMDLFRRTFMGLPWPDGQPMTLPPGVPSIWVCSDAHQDEIAEMLPAFGMPDDAIHFPTTWEDPYGGTDLDNPETWDDIEETIREIHSPMLFIDTLTSATARDLCDQRTIKPLKTNLAYLCQTYQISVLLLLHLNRQGDVLGRRIKGITRTLMLLECPDQDKPERLRLSVPKSFSRKPKALGLTMGEGGNEYDDKPPEAPQRGQEAAQKPREKARLFIVERLTAVRECRVMDLLNEFVGSGGSEGSFWRARDEMVSTGEMTCDGSPKMLRLTGEVPANDPSF